MTTLIYIPTHFFSLINGKVLLFYNGCIWLLKVEWWQNVYIELMECLIVTWDMLGTNSSFIYIAAIYCLTEIHLYGKYSLSNFNSNLNFINDYEFEFAVFHIFKQVLFKIWKNVNKLSFKAHINLLFAEKHWKNCRFTNKRESPGKNASVGMYTLSFSLTVE